MLGIILKRKYHLVRNQFRIICMKDIEWQICVTFLFNFNHSMISILFQILIGWFYFVCVLLLFGSYQLALLILKLRRDEYSFKDVIIISPKIKYYMWASEWPKSPQTNKRNDFYTTWSGKHSQTHFIFRVKRVKKKMWYDNNKMVGIHHFMCGYLWVSLKLDVQIIQLNK